MRRLGGSLMREFFVTIIAHRTETAVCIEGDYVGMSQGRIEGFDMTKSQGHIGSKVSTKHKICSNYVEFTRCRAPQIHLMNEHQMFCYRFN